MPAIFLIFSKLIFFIFTILPVFLIFSNPYFLHFPYFQFSWYFLISYFPKFQFSWYFSIFFSKFSYFQFFQFHCYFPLSLSLSLTHTNSFSSVLSFHSSSRSILHSISLYNFPKFHLISTSHYNFPKFSQQNKFFFASTLSHTVSLQFFQFHICSSSYFISPNYSSFRSKIFCLQCPVRGSVTCAIFLKFFHLSLRVSPGDVRVFLFPFRLVLPSRGFLGALASSCGAHFKLL